MLIPTLMLASLLSGAENCERADRAMALTFDDLPMTRSSYGTETMTETNRAIVSALDRIGAPAVGFVNQSKLYDDGSMAPARVAALRLWTDSGRPIGNHGFAHLDLHRVDVERWCQDVESGQEIVGKLMGRSTAPRVLYFRHPYLHTGTKADIRQRSRECLAAEGLTIAPVTIDNGEWIYAGAYDRLAEAGRDTALQALVADYVGYMVDVVNYYEAQSCKLMDRLIPQVLLLHANRLNGAALPELLTVLEKRGYRFVALDEALADPAYQRDDRYFGSGGISWIHRWALTEGKRGTFFAGEPEVPDSVRQLADGNLDAYE